MADENPWIEWAGGEPPVEADTIVEVRLRDAKLGTMTERADFFDWTIPDEEPRYRDDIIAYRIVS